MFLPKRTPETSAAHKEHAIVQGCTADGASGPLHSPFVLVLFIIISPLPVSLHLCHRVSNSSLSSPISAVKIPALLSADVAPL